MGAGDTGSFFACFVDGVEVNVPKPFVFNSSRAIVLSIVKAVALRPRILSARVLACVMVSKSDWKLKNVFLPTRYQQFANEC